MVNLTYLDLIKVSFSSPKLIKVSSPFTIYAFVSFDVGLHEYVEFIHSRSVIQIVLPVWHLSPCHPGVHEHLFGPVHNP